MNALSAAVCCLLCCFTPQERDEPILIEAERFAETGGWVVDPQFMDNMGSPYLLAHGLGQPVADARTRIRIPIAGDYQVWVRTKDWVAQWNAPGTPGRFQVHLNGQALPIIFGTEGATWHWQSGGTTCLPAGMLEVALHDLTGFEGRCDAIVLSRDPGFRPPNSEPEMSRFRRQSLGIPEEPVLAGDYDFVVTGGGIAGTCAALSAARLGLHVALVQDRPVLGGNNSSEVRVWLQGARNKPPWPRIGDVVAELEQERRAHYGPSNVAELYEDEKKLAIVRAEKNVDLFLEHRVNGVDVDGGRINAVIAQQIRTGKRVCIRGRWFADCTGDACVGALAGADFDIQATDHMGPCNLWNVCECKDTNALNTDTVRSEIPVPFPRCPWALDLSDKPFPGRSKVKPDPNRLGGWYWESGFDRDPIKEMEYIRDWNFRAMYGAWDALKNVDNVFPNYRLNWAAHILGKRESRRLMGDVVLSVDDLKKDVPFPDGCVPTGWSNDVHHADPKYDKGFEGDAFISYADFGDFPAHTEQRPFWIPFRSLYSRNIANLMMAGRCISVDHDALGVVRVMRTGGCGGEILGMAASLCNRFDTDPRGIYEGHLTDLQKLMKRGTGRTPATDSAGRGLLQPPTLVTPAWLESAGMNLARNATITVPGAPTSDVKDYLRLNDGNGNLADNSERWVYREPTPHVIEFQWNEPVDLGAARIISGYHTRGKIVGAIEEFVLQWHDGSQWHEPGIQVEGNTNPGWAMTFPAARTQRARVIINKTQDGISRIWEIEFFAPAKE